MVEYKARTNNRLGIDDDEAQVLGQAMDALEKKLGASPKPADIVEASKSEQSPFHAYIWAKDTAQADWEYRLGVARRLKQAVVIVVVNHSGEQVRAPARVSVTVKQSAHKGNGDTAKSKPVYVTHQRMMGEAELKAQAEKQLFSRVACYRDELSLYPRFSKLVHELDRLKVQYEREAKRGGSQELGGQAALGLA